MLEKRIASNGHIYAKLSSLKQWDKNPRDIYEKNFLKLKILIGTLGLFKPLFVTAEGIMVGGNMRLPALVDLNSNTLNWKDDKGIDHNLDLKGSFDEVPIVELDFAEEESTPGKYRAMLDGVVQNKIFDSIEQAMIEYAVADNMTAGHYDQEKAAELFLPHQESIDMTTLEMNLAPSVQMKTFVDQYQPSNGQPPTLPDKEKGKSKEINVVIKYTPEQFAVVEPRLQKLKSGLGIENITDLFNHMLEQSIFLLENNDATPTAPSDTTEAKEE